MSAVPDLATDARRPLLSVRRLKVHYPLPPSWPWQHGGIVRAVDDVHFNLYPGETLGIVGESGCGKSTLARALVGLQAVTAGGIAYERHDLARLDETRWRPLRREVQLVFQDAAAALDPRMTAGECVAEPLESLCPELDAAARERRVAELLEQVGLAPEHRERHPHELSGGQCQRVGIARALAVRPKVLVCDEPVAALDVTMQRQIVELLARIQKDEGLSMIFIAHDLPVVRHLSHRVLVMYLGKVVEQAPAAELFARPRHPYTRALLAARPGAPADALLEGELPSPADPPSGCVFRTRCPMRDELCAREVPWLRRVGDQAHAACHYVNE
ncbi:MAG TPA: oligopeptide/dipeptide ABC transporter ATP-binding protein [Candidatus Binatia bacterium]|nr:oligopeptide/dipeptide ABC transporter ATP-binding protein [Candidatus Binatia bacterium]